MSELYHFNPYHDPDDGKFTSGSGGYKGGIASALVSKSDKYILRKRKPNIKKAAKLQMRAAKLYGYNNSEAARSNEYEALKLRAKAADKAESVMYTPDYKDDNKYAQEIKDLQTIADRYQKVADILKKQPNKYYETKPTIDGEDFDEWITKNNERITRTINMYEITTLQRLPREQV